MNEPLYKQRFHVCCSAHLAEHSFWRWWHVHLYWSSIDRGIAESYSSTCGARTQKSSRSYMIKNDGVNLYLPDRERHLQPEQTCLYSLRCSCRRPFALMMMARASLSTKLWSCDSRVTRCTIVNAFVSGASRRVHLMSKHKILETCDISLETTHTLSLLL